MPFNFKIDDLPQVIRAGRYPLADRDFSVSYLNGGTNALHIYDYYGKIRLGGNQYDISPGTVTITPTGMDARYDLAKPGFHFCTHFKFSASGEKRGSELSLPLRINLGEAKSAAESKFMNLVWWIQQADSSDEAGHAASLVLQEFLVWLDRIGKSHAANLGHKARTAVVNAAMEIDRYMSHEIRISEICRTVGLSQNYLARLFRSQYGVTMNKYLINRRIEFARHLLECTSLPVKEIGSRIGISDPQHFNKLFRRTTGKSPSSFRKRF
ncbi:MAG: helix-turn-helix transcriptional regulator [Victivallales bacterium]|jgi:AraC-like DNA-binding protein